MKKIYLFPIAAFGLLLTGCDGLGGDATDEVRQYGKYFVEKIAANQLDSLVSTYKDITLADTIIPINSDTIVVTETESGQYDVNLGEGVRIKLHRGDDGKITVTESYGLFSFPKDRATFATKTGMMTDDTPDAVVSERMKDGEFYRWLEDKLYNEMISSAVINSGPTTYNSKQDWDDYGDYSTFKQAQMPVTITNNSSVPISGSDYNISFTDQHWNCCDIEGWGYTKKTASGVDVPPGGTATVVLRTAYTEHWNGHDGYGNNIMPKVMSPDINWKISRDKILDFYQPNGNEYQEYLNSKK